LLNQHRGDRYEIVTATGSDRQREAAPTGERQCPLGGHARLDHED
jgi:hypothetical protein